MQCDMLEQNRSVATRVEAALYDLAKLSKTSGPVMIHECVQRLGGEGRTRTVQTLGGTSEKSDGESRNLISAISQRRNRDA
jgi:hypothetical protein